jgi:DNA-cytosine methyltransferase
MNHGSLFSGIGGFDLAAQWMGWENVFQVEWDKYCQKVLAKNFPQTKRYGDIKEFDGTKYRGRIDIISGGFPCQPFSVAGKQKGKRDDRYLWPEMLRVIREIQPAFVVGENVPGIIKMELENICLALESEGYEVQPFIIPSASIGAWDKRERVWIIAYNHSFRCSNEQKENGQSISNSIGFNKTQKQAGREQQCRPLQSNTITTNIKVSIGKQPRNTRSGRNGCSNGNSDIDCKSLQGHSGYESTKRQKDEIRRNGQANWLRDWIEVASELCRSNARVPNRMDRIKSLGNSVNPYVVYQIFKAIEQLNNS